MKKIMTLVFLTVCFGNSQNFASGKEFLLKNATRVAYNQMMKKQQTRFYSSRNGDNKSDSCFDCCLIAAFCGFVASRIGRN